MSDPGIYYADVYREGGFWVIYLDEIDQVTRAETEDEIGLMARDCVGIALDVPSDSFDLVLVRHPLGAARPQ